MWVTDACATLVTNWERISSLVLVSTRSGVVGDWVREGGERWCISLTTMGHNFSQV